MIVAPPATPLVRPPVVPVAGRQIDGARRRALRVDGRDQQIAAPEELIAIRARGRVVRVVQPHRAHERQAAIARFARERVGVRHQLIAQLGVLLRDRLDRRVVQSPTGGCCGDRRAEAARCCCCSRAARCRSAPQPHGSRIHHTRPCERNDPQNAANWIPARVELARVARGSDRSRRCPSPSTGRCSASS